MAQTAMTVRMDNQQKAQFDKLCEQFGMSANTAINIFVKAVIRSKSIPFSIQAKNEEEDEVTAKAKAAFQYMCDTARENNIDMSLDAVIDTNIIVSSFITKNPSSATRRVINSMLSGKIKPLYNEEILDEYFDVLNRSKFHLSEIRIHELLNFFKQYGIDSSRFPYDGEMPDEDDRVFYEVCLSKEDSFLVTGNLKHFPKEPQVITAAEMMEILDNEL